METRYTTDNIRYRSMTQQELRDEFLLPDLFKEGEINLTYCECERSIVGGAIPTKEALQLEGGKQIAAEYFAERREIGILSIAEAGSITVDGTVYEMGKHDCLYVGKGSKEIKMQSADSAKPAMFYILSYPAHTEYPTTLVKREDTEAVNLGSQKDCNVRTIYKYIHPAGVKSCQLVMGMTVLAEGSVWNTMPAHTHQRRTEVYLYLELPEDGAVFHYLGEPENTRHVITRNNQAVLSPLWSIHSGAGTCAYTFCWGMGGENQDFSDMDHLSITELK